MASRKNKSKISVKGQGKVKKNSSSNDTAVMVLKFAVFAIIIVFLFFSMYNAAGAIGVGIKSILTSLFGGGAFYIPFICVFYFYLMILKVKGDSYKLKAIFATVFGISVSAAGHLISGSNAESLGLSNLGFIMENGRALLNGGILGTYVAEGLRLLTGDYLSVFLSVVLVIVSVCFMFSDIVILIINKLVDLFSNNKKEKTSKIFRVPGVKVDKEAPKPDGEIELPDIFKEGNKGDIVIEKFARDNEKELKKAPLEPEIKTIHSTDDEVKKEPKLTRTELDAVSKELEEAKAVQAVEYVYPKIDFLNKPDSKVAGMSKEQLNQNAMRLISVLHEFGVEAEVVSIQEGPSVTRYEIIPESGVKISKILGLSEDIALRMAAKGIRIAPVPGKTVIGVEIANKEVMPVYIRDVIASDEFIKHKSKIAFALGKDIAGTTVVGDIAKMPHCLIAGATGSGKSVCINTLITSILYKASPEEVKLIMIDPKVVELSVYNGIPHLLIPVVTDPRKSAGALNWAVMEMLNRYNLFAKVGVRDLASYNKYLEKQGEPKLPQIVIIVDELADLMMASPKEVEEYICRLAQLARAAGMHLIIATQRPSVDVITGLIKANIPSRIAFAVSSAIDSRTILDSVGAEKLLGKGDMLYSPVGESKPIRVQGAFITDEERDKLIDFLKQNAQPDYDDSVLDHIEHNSTKEQTSSGTTADDLDEADVMLGQCIEFVVDLGEASVSKLQRRFKLGYSRAARIVDQMEERGIVGPSEGSKPRQVLITHDEYMEMMATNPEWAGQ